MPLITAIVSAKKNCANVHIDGGEPITMRREIIYEYNLKKGMEVDTAAWRDILAANDVLLAYDRALYYLDYAQHSEKQMVEYLQKKQFSPKAIAGAMAKLIEKGYVDDEHYGRALMERANVSGKGKRNAGQILRQKGIESETVQVLLEDWDSGQELEQAKALAQKKVAQLQRREDDIRKIRQKAAASLATRGYSWEIAKNAVDSAMKTIEENDDHYEEMP